MQNFAKVQNSANALRRQSNAMAEKPRVGFILGTGLGDIADMVENPLHIPYEALPDFPLSSVASHAGRFVLGTVMGVPVIIQQGRCHLYEGYSPADVCMGTRVMAEMGIETLVITNAAGALNPLLSAGGVMLITDHINFMQASPLTGPNHDEKGPRFPDMSSVYDCALRTLTAKTALDLGIHLEKGVYLGLRGPQLETPAETRAFRILGADAVGMSTVLESIAAHHLGLKVLAFSCLTNKNLPDCMAETSLEEIIAVANRAGATLTRLLGALVPKL